MMKIFITGGTGFVGTHLSRVCVGAGHEVTVVGSRSLSARAGSSPINRITADTLESAYW